MPPVSLSSRTAPESQLEHVVHLAVTLSARLTRVHIEDVAAAIAEALEQIAAATRVDGCQLLEFSPTGAVSRSHFPPGGAPTAVLEDSLVERLARNEPVAISRPEELPREPTTARDLARRTGRYSILAVPAAVAGKVVCALVLDALQSPRRWPPALVEHLQLLAELLGACLQHSRDEHALRANVSVIETAERPPRSGQRVSERGDQELGYAGKRGALRA